MKAMPRKWIAVATLCAVGASGCATTDGSSGWGSKETWGTVIGAVGGALLGSQIGGGTGRTIAIIAGALAGSALGNWIGSNLDEKDQQALAASTQHALATGQSVDWKSDHSGAAAVITPVSSKTSTQQGNVRRAPVIARVDGLSVLNQPYRAVKSANLRAAPAATADKVGGFREGQTFTALGRTGNDWIAVGRQGVLVGYVHAPLVAPVTQAAADQATDLDSISVAQANGQGFDLDALDPGKAVTEQVALQTTCRTMNYELQTSQGTESKTIDACQSADGAWQLG
ncbi:ligand-binding protein SH3 [Corticimicrobacter populi]|uniref:Ligand-binding protein SH3 n=2 Tax=Corticimicrobacter populi TaxID=2175229 RepID=A0A2V1K7A7_9BURK|nr:ligand-binding protein SH3 [Corticimicrobacter populi]